MCAIPGCRHKDKCMGTRDINTQACIYIYAALAWVHGCQSNVHEGQMSRRLDWNGWHRSVIAGYGIWVCYAELKWREKVGWRKRESRESQKNESFNKSSKRHKLWQKLLHLHSLYLIVLISYFYKSHSRDRFCKIASAINKIPALDSCSQFVCSNWVSIK